MEDRYINFPQSKLLMLAMRNKEDIHHVLAVTAPAKRPPAPSVEACEDVIFNHLHHDGSLSVVSGMSDQEILSLFHLMQPQIVSIRTPGSQPHSSYLDMLLCYLIWACLQMKGTMKTLPGTKFGLNVSLDA